MNRTGLRVLAASCSFLFWGIPQGIAQTGSPVPPLPSQVPTPPVRIGTSTVTTVEKIVSDAVAAVNQSGDKATGMAKRSIVLNSRVFNGLPEKRLNIELVDVPLKDALKRVLDDSKTPYVIDDDVPNEPKVSIKLANAPLTTILDALTLSNQIGWRTEFKHSPTEATKDAPKEEKASANIAISGSYLALSSSGNYVTQIHVGKTVTALPSSFQFRTLDIEGSPATAATQNAIRGMVAPQTPQMRVYRWQSQKRTFTCPRCHNSISILQQPAEVKCTKCQRSFEDSWKVCPFDGTKRPEPKDKWHFCPICGKSITMETSWSAPSKFPDYNRLNLPAAGFESGPAQPYTYYSDYPGVFDYPGALEHPGLLEDSEGAWYEQIEENKPGTFSTDLSVPVLAPLPE